MSRPWAARLYRGTRRLLERALGPARVERWAERIPYKHLTYCLVTWTTRVPEEVERKLQTSGFLLRDGTAADIDALEGERLYDDCATYRAWLAEGQQLLVAEEAGRVVSYVWLDLARSIALENLPEYQVEIGPGAAYGHEAWTLPSHRGRSLRRLTYVAEVLAARRAGKQWLVHVVQGGGFRVTWHRRPRRPHEAARFVSTSRRR